MALLARLNVCCLLIVFVPFLCFFRFASCELRMNEL
jgi:hypothetical protein